MKKKQRLQEKYEKEVRGAMIKEFGIKNPTSVPFVKKVVLNMGVGEAARQKENLKALEKEMAIIAGQMPSVRPAKVSIASFNLRIGMPVGLSVTLRRDRMYAFLDRLFSIVLPRLRDFRGVSLKSFDKVGNYTLGIHEHTVFPEIDSPKSGPHGLEITIVTDTKDPEKAKKLLELLGMPFEKSQEEKN